MSPFAAIIPAAGHSGRMGTDKALLCWDDGMTFAEKLTDGFSKAGCDPVILVISEKRPPLLTNPALCTVVVNHRTDLGRTWSIRLGAAKTGATAGCFIQNIDNPFIFTGLVHRMMEMATPGSYIVPVCGGRGGHPVLLGAGIVKDLLSSGPQVDFLSVLSRFQRKEIVWNDDRILQNINTSKDYRDFLFRIREAHHDIGKS
jgi:CTP:molybdopterin cytidylyltransferase MocA